MEQWQDAASQQIEPLTNRLNELMSKGLGLLRSELGMDLGLKPELIPSWVILLAVCAGLLLMVALWASACQALFKTRPAVRPADSEVVNVKLEEPKRKKKDAEKASLPNGRDVTEPQEEPIDETEPYHLSTPQKSKKSKKKIKQAYKETKAVKADGKEPEEGSWETKVSSKEKREQRKKDKSSNDGPDSPGGGNTPASAPPEQPKASALLSQKKKKVVTPCITDVADEVPAHAAAQKTDPWTSSKETPSPWRAEIDESWTVIERGITTAEGNLSLPGSTAEPQPMMESLWLSQPKVEDEWSGLHGGSLDPTSDWNAPAVAWGNFEGGNYEEPTPEPPQTQEKPRPDPATVNLLVGVAPDEEDEKVEVETAADGADKVKKKKKKKKAAEEEEAGFHEMSSDDLYINMFPYVYLANLFYYFLTMKGFTFLSASYEGIDISKIYLDFTRKLAHQPSFYQCVPQGEEREKEIAPTATVKKIPPLQENTAAVQPVRAADAEFRPEQLVKDNISKTQVPQRPSNDEPIAKRNSPAAPKQQSKYAMRSKPQSLQRRRRREERHENTL
ncbi:protein LYRIC-like [Labrus mixtus]|uniref:protein LYRIC-like n=1 Tax=Labrus mixtus TaxID=508554 RepID=UPI0029C03EE8|nr:protein LYRIC-like [Labrus mixtus]